MMAEKSMGTGIVYSEVTSGGHLFEGKKFFFLQRLPSRQNWIDLVKSNGGFEVRLDTLADIIIADHARKDCPADSVSWKYIDFSVRKGRLEDIQEHKIGLPMSRNLSASLQASSSPNPARRLAQSGAIRNIGGRVPFTVEDDRILMECITRAERNGVSIKGNVIFEELAAANSRHTAQSWRARWVKKLSLSQRLGPLHSESEDNLEIATEIESKRRPRLKVASKPEAASKYNNPLQKTTPIPELEPEPEPESELDVDPQLEKMPELELETEWKAGDGEQDTEDTSEDTSELGQVAGEESSQIFATYLEKFVEFTGQDIDFSPRVSNTNVSLSTIWHVTRSDKLRNISKTQPLFWLRVARQLGFVKPDNIEAARQLKVCYQSNLAEFETFFESFEANKDDEEEDEDEDERMDVDEPDKEPQGIDQIEIVPGPTTSQQKTLSEQAIPDETGDEAELQTYIDTCIALGYSQEIVLDALFATTMETGDARIVMESLLMNQEIPQNMNGVWTKEDDQALTSAPLSLIEKHGVEKMQARRQFLADSAED